jgi:hypothetical protein
MSDDVGSFHQYILNSICNINANSQIGEARGSESDWRPQYQLAFKQTLQTRVHTDKQKTYLCHSILVQTQSVKYNFVENLV